MAASNRIDFLALTIKHSGRVNRIVTGLRLTPAFDPANPPTPFPQLYETSALWDTGASGSVVTQATASALGLISVGSRMVNHAGGNSQANTYVVNVFLPNAVAVPGVMVTECPAIAGGVGAIIGMDIISLGDFTITNVNGQTWMTFRVPSIKTVDYVIEANKIKFHGVGRNSPCPCGKKDENGKAVKFKFCHEAECR